MEILSDTDLLSGQILQLNTTIRLKEDESINSINLNEIIVNANEPDIFTMIPLKQLILESRQLKKDFILAKIISDSPNNSDDFNYYYHAPELNKVLFKFESERRLLHRMKVRNPLNNLYIIGKVFYYKITPQEIDEQINKKLLELKIQYENEMKDYTKEKSTSLLMTNTSQIESDNILKETSEHTIGSLLEPNKHTHSEFPKYDTIQYIATFVGTDDDFLTKAAIREYFRKNSDDTDEFIFELDRRNNDLIALLESGSDTADDPTGFWKKIFSIHITMLMGMMIILLLLGSNHLVSFIVLPIAGLILLSFLCTVIYLICIRRTTFDSLAVESVDEI